MVRSLSFLVLAQVAVLATWFSVNAVIPALTAATGLPAQDFGALGAATQIGFVAGCLGFAASGLPDRVDPRAVFAVSALVAAAANLGPMVLPPTSAGAIGARALVGVALAGVYPVGLKIALGWTAARRGLVASLLVGALTLGSSVPHWVVLSGGVSVRAVLVTSSVCAVIGAVMILAAGLGPYHAAARRFDPGAIRLLGSRPGLRRATLGYVGHMWELYAFWGWAPVALAAAYGGSGGAEGRALFAAGVMAAAMGLGGLACVPFGLLADRVGKARVAHGLLLSSAAAAGLSALLADAAPMMVAMAIILWGITIIPDSPLFSALASEAAPPEQAGSVLTLQVAIGFAVSALSIQLVPALVAAQGWPLAFGVLALGPAFGALGLRGAKKQAPQSL